jgi:Helix-turn-helix domain
MGTASIHEGVRRMRFSSLLDRTEAKELTQAAASELLGINVRTFQRWADRYEAEGDDGLVDRRMGRRSPRRAPEEELERMLAAVPGQVRGFHGEALPRAAAKASTPAASGHAAAPGRVAPRLDRRSACDGPIVTMPVHTPGLCTHLHLFTLCCIPAECSSPPKNR